MVGCRHSSKLSTNILCNLLKRYSTGTIFIPILHLIKCPEIDLPKLTQLENSKRRDPNPGSVCALTAESVVAMVANISPSTAKIVSLPQQVTRYGSVSHINIFST